MHRVVAPDDCAISATAYAPEGEAKAAILIVPAMGAVQKFYAAMAAWLAEQGYWVATFDYRGVGASRAGSLRNFEADILDWAQLDCAAMIDFADRAHPQLPLYWLGHSLGGQILPWVPNRDRVAKAIFMASGEGYWRRLPRKLRPAACYLWFVLVPLLVPVWGYFPGRRLGKVGDLPKGAIRQWRRWCLDPHYNYGAEREGAAHYESVRMPIAMITFTDDEIMSGENAEALLRFYVNAPQRATRLQPADLGVPRIGHFGCFKPAFSESLWRSHLLPELRSQ